MNCRQIRDLMDTQSFKDWQSSNNQRLRYHIENCPACRAAFSAVKALDTGLRNLADPELPSGMSEGIMARIARLEQDPFDASIASQQVFKKTGVEGSRRNVFGWAAITAGTAISFGAMLRNLLMKESAFELISPRIGKWSNLINISDVSVINLFVIVGLLLVFAGFLSTLLRTERPRIE